MTNKRTWSYISLSAGLALGLIFLVAGIGKLLAQSEFAGVLVMQTFLPERLAKMVSYSVPIVEVIVGGLLILGFYPRLIAVFSLLLSGAFIANNAWLLSLGLKCPKCPHCFGKLEELFGTLTTWQALYIDIVLVLLAVAVLVFSPGGFFTSRFWFLKPRPAKTEASEQK